MTPGPGPPDLAFAVTWAARLSHCLYVEAAEFAVPLQPVHLHRPKRLSTPRLARALSATNRGLLPGAPVPTGTGISTRKPDPASRMDHAVILKERKFPLTELQRPGRLHKQNIRFV